MEHGLQQPRVTLEHQHTRWGVQGEVKLLNHGLGVLGAHREETIHPC